MAESIDKRARILLVEDNPADVFMLREALDRAEVAYDLTQVSEGERALSALEALRATSPEQWPDLVLLDLNLPRIDGSDLLRFVAAEPALDNLQVAVFTSSDAPADRELARQCGAAGYLVKPSDLDSFLAIGREIKRLCGQ